LEAPLPALVAASGTTTRIERAALQIALKKSCSSRSSSLFAHATATHAAKGNAGAPMPASP